MTDLARFQRTVVDDTGAIIPSPTIEVRNQISNALVSIFSDRAGASALSNPFTGTSEGLAAFHVAGGVYKITATSGSFTAEWTWVGIGTASEFDFVDLTDYVDDTIEAAVPPIFPVDKGGTGRSSLTAENILIGDGTNAVKFVAPGTSGQVLTSDGTVWASSALPQQITATTGSAPYYGARAWVNFSGNTSPGTILQSQNVSSVTRNSTGDYTVNFTTAMPNADYCVNVSGVMFSTTNGTLIYNIYGSTSGAQSKTASAVRVTCSATNAVFINVGEVNVVVFG
jgi:hypothetical protein